jgi:predicted ATPase
LNSPLVGRGVELARLRRAIAEVIQGRGQIIFLVGDAGLGKSRLIEELRSAWVDEGGATDAWVEVRGVAYEANRPYGVFRQFLEQLFPVGQIDGLNTMRMQLLPTLQGEMRAHFENMLQALGMGAAQSARQEIDARNAQQVEAARRQFFESVYAIWKELARQRPRVAVFDDLHWADAASVELLQHLYRLCDEVPLLLLCAERPMRHAPAWRARQHAETEFPHAYTEIKLLPLSTEASLELIDNLMPLPSFESFEDPDHDRRLPEDLRRLILKKAEGNPFFVEELVRALIDDGVIQRNGSGNGWLVTQAVKELQLPESLQALLTARIDRLEPSARQILQVASVIGRVFNYQVLQEVAGAWWNQEGLNLDEHLTMLQRAGLVNEQRRLPVREYIFYHELTREAAYQSILVRRRRQIHRLVGETIESLSRDKLEEQANRLVEHFRESQDYDRALHYAILAGDHAYQLYALPEAITMYGQAISLSGKGQQTMETDVLGHVYTRRGRVLEFAGDYPRALANYQELEQLGIGSGDQRLELAALIPQAIIYSTYTGNYDPGRGQQIAERALALAEKTQNPQSEARALWTLLLFQNYTQQNPEKGIVYGERALKIARQHNLREEQAYILNDLSRVYVLAGHIRDAFATLAEAQLLWRELDNQPMLADSLNNLAESLHLFGEYDRSLEAASEALEIGRKIDNLWSQAYSQMLLGPVYFEKGLIGQALQVLRQSIDLAEQANFQAPQFMSRLVLSLIYAYLGDLEMSRQLINQILEFALIANPLDHNETVLRSLLLSWENKPEEALDNLTHFDQNYAPSITDVYYGPPIVIFLEEIYLASRHYQELLEKSALILERITWSGMQLFAPDLWLYQGKALVELGRMEEGLQALATAQEEARTQGSHRILWHILAYQAEQYDRLGEAARAAALRQEAGQIASFIAGQIVLPGDPTGEGEKLRQDFLDLPQVRGLILAAEAGGSIHV